MKTSILSLLILILGLSAYAQDNSKENPEDQVRKIETIKIVDGDTIMHSVDMVNGNGPRGIRRMRMEHIDHEGIEEMLEEIDMYISADDVHKKMIVKKLHRSDVDIDSLLESVDEDEDIVIDIDKTGEGKKIKVIKIQVEDEDGAEETVIEIDNDRVVRHREERMERRHDRMAHGRTSDVKVFPNQDGNEVKIIALIHEPNTKVKVSTDKGAILFEKEYAETGRYDESIKLKKDQKGTLMVELENEKTAITKKLMVE